MPDDPSITGIAKTFDIPSPVTIIANRSSVSQEFDVFINFESQCTVGHAFGLNDF